MDTADAFLWYRSCYLRRSVSHILDRDRDWIYGPEVDELLSCDPQFILLTCQEWAALNYIKSTTIKNAGNDKVKAMQFDKRTLCKCKKPFKYFLYKVIQSLYTTFVRYCVFKKLMKDIIIAALPITFSKMTPSWIHKHFGIVFQVPNNFSANWWHPALAIKALPCISKEGMRSCCFSFPSKGFAVGYA